jgi:hypothetical protein
MDIPTLSKRKPQVRYGKLDGKPPAKPRGRHAVPLAEDEPKRSREVVTIPVNQRLGYRVREFAALCGVSYPTIWRDIRDKKIPVIVVGGVKLISRAHAIRCGLISENEEILGRERPTDCHR